MTAAQSHSPTGHHHALVWIDHHEARIYRFDSEVSESTHHSSGTNTPPAPASQGQLNWQRPRAGQSRVSGGQLPRISSMPSNVTIWALLKMIVGVETLDHPRRWPAAGSWRKSLSRCRPDGASLFSGQQLSIGRTQGGAKQCMPWCSESRTPRWNGLSCPDPIPGPGQVRIRVAACGVCRTDLHVIDGELPEPKLPIIRGIRLWDVSRHSARPSIP